MDSRSHPASIERDQLPFNQSQALRISGSLATRSGRMRKLPSNATAFGPRLSRARRVFLSGGAGRVFSAVALDSVGEFVKRGSYKG